MKKKKRLHRHICSITSPLSESLKLILSMPQSTTALRFYIVFCAVDYSQVLSLIKNENTLFESCYSLINFFFCQQSFFWRLLAAHNSAYVGEIRDSVDLVSRPVPVTDG